MARGTAGTPTLLIDDDPEVTGLMRDVLQPPHVLDDHRRGGAVSLTKAGGLLNGGTRHAGYQQVGPV